MESRKLALLCRELADNKKADDIVILDVRELSSVTDYFVIASGTSEPHLRAIVDEITEKLRQSHQLRARAVDGTFQTAWVVLDYFDVIVHVTRQDVHDHVDELGCSVGEALLVPTRIYARPLRQILGHYKVKSVVHGIAHITGGGIGDNLERILPARCQAVLRRGSWPMPAVFNWLARLGDVDAAEMGRVFNMGLGMILVVSPFYAESIRSQLGGGGLESFVVGQIADGPAGVIWENEGSFASVQS